MSAPDLSRQRYRPPVATRMVDPQRMNWLWRLIFEAANLQPAELVDALHAMRVPADANLLRGWLLDNRDERYLPVSMTEIERNLRAVVALRHTLRRDTARLDGPATSSPRPASVQDQPEPTE